MIDPAGDLSDLLAQAEINEVSYLTFAGMVIERERGRSDVNCTDLNSRTSGFQATSGRRASSTATRSSSASEGLPLKSMGIFK